MSTLTIAIGNSDDKLPQAVWSRYWSETAEVVRGHADHVYGEFLSLPSAPFQNACWVVQGQLTDHFRDMLAEIARRFGQDSIAVSVGETVMVG